MKTEKIKLTLAENILEALKKKAEREGYLSTAALIRAILNEVVKNENEIENKEQAG